MTKTLDELEGIARARGENTPMSVEESILYLKAFARPQVLDLIARARRAERLEMALEVARNGLQDAKDALECACDDIGNCVENSSVPTKSEYLSCRAYLDDTCDSLAAIDAALKEE